MFLLRAVGEGEYIYICNYTDYRPSALVRLPCNPGTGYPYSALKPLRKLSTSESQSNKDVARVYNHVFPIVDTMN